MHHVNQLTLQIRKRDRRIARKDVGIIYKVFTLWDYLVEIKTNVSTKISVQSPHWMAHVLTVGLVATIKTVTSIRTGLKIKAFVL